MTATTETLTFDPSSSPVAVTDRTNYWVQAFEYTPARPKTEWAESADTDGALPENADHYTNAEATLQIRVAPQSTRDAALNLIQAIVAKGQKARRQVMTDGIGIPVEWSPKGSTRVGTMYLLEADDWHEEMNVTEDPGDLRNAPLLTVHMTFAPFVYGPTVTESTLTINEPVEGMTATITGDVRTPGTIVVTDTATQNRKQLTIAQGADTSSTLYYSGTSLVITGTSSTRVTDADAFVGGATIADLTGLFTGYQDFFSISDLPHRGPFRVVVRAKSTADEEEVSLRLQWRIGNGPWRANDPAVVPGFSTAAYAETDLGTVYVPEGAPNLDLRVQARSDTVTAAEGVRADILQMLPGERMTVICGEDVQVGGTTLSWYDGFNHGGFPLPETLIGTSPELGTGNWTEAGDVDDWQLIGAGIAYRAPTVADADLNTGQYATAGPTTLAAVTAEWTDVFVEHNGGAASGGKEVRAGGVVRFVDANNYLGIFIRVKRMASGSYNRWLTLYKRVAGTVTQLKQVQVKTTALTDSKTSARGSIKISVTAAGVATVSTGPIGGATDQAFTVTDAVLASAAALDDGKVGIYQATDLTNAKGRATVDSVVAYSTTAATQFTYAVPSGSSTTVIGSEAVDASSNPIPLRGASFLLEPGSRRIAFKTRRGRDGEADTGFSDTGSAVVSYKPAWLTHPGS